MKKRHSKWENSGLLCQVLSVPLKTQHSNSNIAAIVIVTKHAAKMHMLQTFYFDIFHWTSNAGQVQDDYCCHRLYRSAINYLFTLLPLPAIMLFETQCSRELHTIQ